jgi:hypothetical protein
MAKVFDAIDTPLREWIAKQHMYFVATAPLDGEGHVNVSPKGPIGTLRVLDDHTVVYLDFVGSGAETIAHLRENGRIVVMLCAFAGPPRILRLHGCGEVVRYDEARFAELYERLAFEEPSIPEAHRSIVLVEVTRISDSCGYGVPLMRFEGDRDHHALSSAKKLRVNGLDGLRAINDERNAQTLDGLPAL